MIKRIFIYIATLMSLAACSEDIFDSPSRQLPENGEVIVSFSVPEMQKVQTRADYESDITNTLALVFASNADGAKLLQKETLSLTDNSAKLKIKNENRANTGLYFVFVANYSTTFDDAMEEGTTTLKTLKEYKASVDEGTSALVLSGEKSLSDFTGYSITVPMMRNAAKISCNMGTSPSSLGAAMPFTSYGFNEKGSIVAGAYSLLSSPTAPTSPMSWKPDSDNADYVVATTNGDSDPHPFIIVAANQYYYRLDFRTLETEGDDEGKITYLNVLPNHHYQFIIKAISGIGYKTLEEAAKHPTLPGVVDYEIHDHAPVILNMTSDGLHELGVSDVRVDEDGNKCFYVKVFKKKGTAPAFDKNCISIDEAYSSWLDFDRDNISVVSGVDFVGTQNTSDPNKDLNDAGTLYKVILTLTETMEQGDLSGSVNVSWAGLTRDVPVVWERSFEATDLFEGVDLYMYEGTTEKHSFLQNSNQGYFTYFLTKDVSLGTSETANNGEARNEGLHFPNMYGEKDKLWRYKYVIKFKDLNNGEAYDWEASVSGPESLQNAISWGDDYSATSPSGTCTNSGPEIVISCDPDLDGYYTGKLIINVTPKSEGGVVRKSIPYPVNIYHTGFFHQDDYSYATDDTNSGKWIYYEVIKDDNGNHWLDRNLGATSAELYIESAGSHFGNPEAAGKYYRVAKYNLYATPILQEGICPPGYTVPSSNQMDALRKSANFNTQSAGAYYNSLYYDSASGKTSYFPKARYLDVNNNKTGDLNAGYYWTRTAASGLEKFEFGNWLKCLTISGVATSYINGCVDNRNSDYKGTTEGPGYAMNVRCMEVKDDIQVEPEERTYFFVKGATHIYLYTGEGDDRTAVTTWPGIAIGNYSTVYDYFNFSYESSAFNPGDLKVIFNYKDEKGRIHTLSRNPANENLAKYSTALNPSDLVGWKVKDGIAPNWNDYGNATITTSLGGYWYIDASEKKGGFYSGKVLKKYRIYWTTAGDRLHIWEAEKGEGITDWNSRPYKIPSDVEGYYMYDFEKDINEAHKLGYKLDGGTDWSSESTISKLFTYDSSVGRYCAYITENANNKVFPGKPTDNGGGGGGGSGEENTYRIYWDIQWSGIDRNYIYVSQGCTGLAADYCYDYEGRNGNAAYYEFKSTDSGFTIKYAPQPSAWATDSGNRGSLRTASKSDFKLNGNIYEYKSWGY